MQTYAELKTRIIDEMGRTDLGDKVQGWVSVAEAFIVSRLRVREMVKTDATLTATDGVMSLPADHLETRDMRLADNMDVMVRYAPPEQVFSYEDSGFGSGRGYWSILGDNIYIRPKPSDAQVYFMEYLARPLSLTDVSQETNAIFPKYSNLYLYGALWQGWTRVRNQEKANANLETLTALIEVYNQQHKREKQGSATLRVMAPTVA